MGVKPKHIGSRKEFHKLSRSCKFFWKMGSVLKRTKFEHFTQTDSNRLIPYNAPVQLLQCLMRCLWISYMLRSCHVRRLKKNLGHSVAFTPMTSQILVKNHTPPILTLKEPYPLRAGQTNVEMINLEMRAEIRMSAKLLDWKTTSSLTLWESNPSKLVAGKNFTYCTFPANFLEKMGLVLKATNFDCASIATLQWYYKRLLLATQRKWAWTLIMISLVIHVTGSLVETTHQKLPIRYIIWSLPSGTTHCRHHYQPKRLYGQHAKRVYISKRITSG